MERARTGVEPGWAVVGSDGGKVGTVTSVREDHLVVERGVIHKHNLYVPIGAVASSTDGHTVSLNVPAGEVDESGWRFPPNAGYEHGETPYPEVPDTTMIQAAGYSAGSLSAPEAQGYVRDVVEGDGDADEQIPNALYNPEGTDRPGFEREN